jgi:hypothetical protein
MILNTAGASVALVAVVMACSPVQAQDAPTETAAEASDPFVPTDFEVPVQVDADGFKLVPLGPDLVDVDYVAYMSSIEHLQQTFTRSTSWPREGITDEEAMLDMETEEGRFLARESFAYGVLTPDGSRERGSLYVRPSPVEGYDAVVMLWVTKAITMRALTMNSMAGRKTGSRPNGRLPRSLGQGGQLPGAAGTRWSRLPRATTTTTPSLKNRTSRALAALHP